MSSYYDNTGRSDTISGGERMIPITTPIGDYRVWTKRIGNNPRIKVLLLHGGPGFNHDQWASCDSYFPGAGIEYYLYDQLGSYLSDQPTDDSLWVTERFVEEVEQVRRALGLDNSNFYLMGQSWGGILAAEYALKYQRNLKGLIISNMMMSAPEYGRYAKEVLGPQMKPEVLAEVLELEEKEDFGNPRYEELLMENYYVEHILRIPLEEWPVPIQRGFQHLNQQVYTIMQGPSEFGIRGRLAEWDRTRDIHKIKVPTLVIGATYDTMDPKHMEWVASELEKGEFLLCPKGSHLCNYDDHEVYFSGVIDFIKRVDELT